MHPWPPDDGVAYTYGNRLHCHFGCDSVGWLYDNIRVDINSRSAYATLWDNKIDGKQQSSPCLVSIFFRLHSGALTMTATYRAHNAMDAWLKNFYGLMAIQKFVCDGAGLPPGPITVISHSISINLDFADSTDRIAPIVADIRPDSDERDRDTGKVTLAEDPCGAFVISHDPEEGVIIADLTQDGDLLQRYTGRTAAEIEQQIARDRSVSLLSHAMYVGRELAKAETRLRNGKA